MSNPKMETSPDQPLSPLPPPETELDSPAKEPEKEASPSQGNPEPPKENVPGPENEKPPPASAKVSRNQPRLDQSPFPLGTPSHLTVEILDPEIMAMNSGVVITSLELVNRGIDEFNRQSAELTKRKNDIDVRLKNLGTRSSALCRYQLQLEKTQKPGAHVGIKAYQDRCQESREEKRVNAMRFIKAGTSPADVIKQLTTKAPIDLAFSQRRPQGRTLLSKIS